MAVPIMEALNPLEGTLASTVSEGEATSGFRVEEKQDLTSIGSLWMWCPQYTPESES